MPCVWPLKRSDRVVVCDEHVPSAAHHAIGPTTSAGGIEVVWVVQRAPWPCRNSSQRPQILLSDDNVAKCLPAINLVPNSCTSQLHHAECSPDARILCAESRLLALSHARGTRRAITFRRRGRVSSYQISRRLRPWTRLMLAGRLTLAGRHSGRASASLHPRRLAWTGIHLAGSTA
jgi:hypothetical protein